MMLSIEQHAEIQVTSHTGGCLAIDSPWHLILSFLDLHLLYQILLSIQHDFISDKFIEIIIFICIRRTVMQRINVNSDWKNGMSEVVR